MIFWRRLRVTEVEHANRTIGKPRKRPRGRPRKSIYRELALDYLVTRELVGWRRWKVARLEVASAWGVKPETVADAWTDSKSYARWKLASLIDPLVGRTEVRRGVAVVRTRRKLLEDLSADLREMCGR